MTVPEVLSRLNALANPDKVLFKQQKFGIVANNALGVYIKDVKEIAKEIGTNNELAIELFDTGIYEARILCSKVFKPKDVTEELMEKWVVTFENWEMCDSFSMALFSKSPFAVKKIRAWSSREAEFEKRSAFATLASYCMADKKSGNELFESFLPILLRESSDSRLYVRKAVNWALRSIGKRNQDLKESAINTAMKISEENPNCKTAQWIASDALKELQGEKLNVLDYPRAIYRPTQK